MSLSAVGFVLDDRKPTGLQHEEMAIGLASPPRALPAQWVFLLRVTFEDK